MLHYCVPESLCIVSGVSCVTCVWYELHILRCGCGVIYEAYVVAMLVWYVMCCVCCVLFVSCVRFVLYIGVYRVFADCVVL